MEDPFEPRIDNAFERNPDAAHAAQESPYHLISQGVICDTDSVGHEQPGGRSSTELVLDSPDGYIPLWAPNSKLYWRFEERAFSSFVRPAAAKAYIRDLMAAAIDAWGAAVPVRFKERSHGVDFDSRLWSVGPRSVLTGDASWRAPFFPILGSTV